jgi:hypothetical protein
LESKNLKYKNISEYSTNAGAAKKPDAGAPAAAATSPTKVNESAKKEQE